MTKTDRAYRKLAPYLQVHVAQAQRPADTEALKGLLRMAYIRRADLNAAIEEAERALPENPPRSWFENFR